MIDDNSPLFICRNCVIDNRLKLLIENQNTTNTCTCLPSEVVLRSVVILSEAENVSAPVRVIVAPLLSACADEIFILFATKIVLPLVALAQSPNRIER